MHSMAAQQAQQLLRPSPLLETVPVHASWRVRQPPRPRHKAAARPLPHVGASLLRTRRRRRGTATIPPSCQVGAPSPHELRPRVDCSCRHYLQSLAVRQLYRILGAAAIGGGPFERLLVPGRVAYAHIPACGMAVLCGHTAGSELDYDGISASVHARSSWAGRAGSRHSEKQSLDKAQRQAELGQGPAITHLKSPPGTESVGSCTTSSVGLRRLVSPAHNCRRRQQAIMVWRRQRQRRWRRTHLFGSASEQRCHQCMHDRLTGGRCAE
jgi:hypothetical protein